MARRRSPAATCRAPPVPTTHPHFAYVGAIEREISRIAGVTRQLYETYRPEHQIGETALPGLVADAVALLEQINRDSRVRITTDLTRSPAQVPIPDAVLRQTVYNLVQNAVEASPSGSTVEVSAAVEEKVLVLRIRDRGPGIPAEIRARAGRSSQLRTFSIVSVQPGSSS